MVALCIWMMSSLSPTAIGVELPVLAPTVSDVAPTATDAEVPGKYEFTIPPSVGCGPSAPGVPHVLGAAVASGTGPARVRTARPHRVVTSKPQNASVGDASYKEHAAAGLIRRDT